MINSNGYKKNSRGNATTLGAFMIGNGFVGAHDPESGNLEPRQAGAPTEGATGQGIAEAGMVASSLPSSLPSSSPSSSPLSSPSSSPSPRLSKHPFKSLPWQVTMLSWVLLALQGLIMVGLYQSGEGRTAALEDRAGATLGGDDDKEPPVCSVASGPPALAEVVWIRAITALCAQLATLCISSLGLLKPHEAVWVICTKVVRFWAKAASFCCGIVTTLPTVGTLAGKGDSVGGTGSSQGAVPRRYARRDSCGLGRLAFVLLWIIAPAALVWGFSVVPATVNLRGVCGIVSGGGEAIFWLRVGGAAVTVLCSAALCYACNSRETGSTVPYVRAFVVVDSLVFGATAVWGNYVQSGALALVFALLPALNIFITGLETLR